MARRASTNSYQKSQLGEPYQIYTEVTNAGKNLQGKNITNVTVEMSKLVMDFCIKGHHYFNGKVLPVSTSNP